MTVAVSSLGVKKNSNPAPWRLDWLTPARCRLVFAALSIIGALSQVAYLHHAPIDLSGDEAHYWDWSRRLDLSYYSKGPAVAYLIRASCAMFGDTMPAVRYPAIVLALMTSIVTYLLTLRLFKSDRLALGVALLNTFVPMFVAGSLLMTIDPPLFFCWAAATYSLTFAIDLRTGRLGRSAVPWIAAGVFIGLGFLAKYAALLWLPAVLIYLTIDSRGVLKTRRPWVMVIVALLFTSPVLAWNSKHDWVTFRHVARQTGMTDDSDNDADERAANGKSSLETLGRFGAFVGGQLGVVGPIWVLMVAGAVYAMGPQSNADPRRRALRMLTVVGGFFFLLTFLGNYRGKVQINWPAPAYFTLVIVAGYFISLCLQDPIRWKRWKGWVYATIGLGLIMQPITRDFSLLYPVARKINATFGTKIAITRLDPTVKLRGWNELGQYLGAELAKMPPGTFILCDDYQQTAETAFYTPGQPVTYYAGSYFNDPKRRTQYDIWPDRQLTPPNPLIGRDAIYVGKAGLIPREVARAFEHVEPLTTLEIKDGDTKIRSFRPFRCTGFKGMARPADISDY